MWNPQYVIFMWGPRYWQIFKSALVYLYNDLLEIITIKSGTLYKKLFFSLKFLKSKKKNPAPNSFCYVRRDIWLGQSKKLICIDKSRFYMFSYRENSKMFNTTSKYFSFFKKTPPASWVAHITTCKKTRGFLTCYSCSYYSSMFLYRISLEPCSRLNYVQLSFRCAAYGSCNCYFWHKLSRS